MPPQTMKPIDESIISKFDKAPRKFKYDTPSPNWPIDLGDIIMPQSMQEKNAINMERRKQAYDLLKELAQKCGIMRHSMDGHGYDELVGMLESGEFQLELVQQESE